MKDSKTLLFDIDGTLRKQRLNSIFPVKLINCRSHEYSIGHITKESHVIKVLQNTCKKHLAEFTLSFFGSGDFHHLTLFILEQIESPFFLIMFDRHYDVGLKRVIHKEFIDYSCGGWAYNALHLPLCKGATFIGPQSTRISRWVQGVSYLEKNRNLNVIPDYEANKVESLIQSLSKVPKDCNIYISIDKDVLNEEALETDWGNGAVTEDELFSMLQHLAINFSDRIKGVDVCGDPRGVFWWTEQTPFDVLQKHSEINRKIMKLFYSYLKDPYEVNRLEKELIK